MKRQPTVLAAGALAALLAAAAPSASGLLFTYAIVLKDGTRIEAKEKPIQKGKNLIYKTPLGATQSILASEVDTAKTEEVNKDGLGGSYILDTPKVEVPTPVPTKSIGSIAAGSSKGAEMGTRATPTTTPLPKEKPKKS